MGGHVRSSARRKTADPFQQPDNAGLVDLLAAGSAAAVEDLQLELAQGDPVVELEAGGCGVGTHPEDRQAQSDCQAAGATQPLCMCATRTAVACFTGCRWTRTLALQQSYLAVQQDARLRSSLLTTPITELPRRAGFTARQLT